jgi:hypothetical protein
MRSPPRRLQWLTPAPSLSLLRPLPSSLRRKPQAVNSPAVQDGGRAASVAANRTGTLKTKKPPGKTGRFLFAR